MWKHAACCGRKSGSWYGAVLADGKIVAIGPIAEVLASPHPWVQAYFKGKRARALNPADNRG